MFINTEAGEVFCKNGVLVSFREVHKKASMLESLIKNVAGYWSIKKRLGHRCFPVNCAKFLRHLF